MISESVARDRFFVMLFAIFATLAVCLAAVGIYGVLAYAVGRRTQEIGVRMALGASAADVVRMVLRQGMVLVGAGILIGTVAGLLLSRVIESQLYGISATDPLSVAASLAVLTAVALIATWLPVRRAVRWSRRWRCVRSRSKRSARLATRNKSVDERVGPIQLVRTLPPGVRSRSTVRGAGFAFLPPESSRFVFQQSPRVFVAPGSLAPFVGKVWLRGTKCDRCTKLSYPNARMVI